MPFASATRHYFKCSPTSSSSANQKYQRTHVHTYIHTYVFQTCVIEWVEALLAPTIVPLVFAKGKISCDMRRSHQLLWRGQFERVPQLVNVARAGSAECRSRVCGCRGAHDMWREVSITTTPLFANGIAHIEGLQVGEMLELQRFENGYIFPWNYLLY